MSPERRRLRLPHYDYTQAGATFVTVCLSPRVPILSRVVGEGVVLSHLGELAASELGSLPLRFTVQVDTSIVMPDHLHAILLTCDGGPSVSQVVGAFKSLATRRVNEARGTPGEALFQRSFFDHVVRDEDDLERCRAYIATNPARWWLSHGHDLP